MKIIELDQQRSEHSLKELERSHSILNVLMAGLSSPARRELVGLLQILSEGAESQESSDSIRQRALQIVSGICKPHQIQEQTPLKILLRGHQQGLGERRQRDRRQQSANSGKPWTTQQEQILRNLAEQNIPIRRIALKLGRSSTAVHSKAREINIPLNSTKVPEF
ncbi:hypothetical protein [Nitrosospira sp. Nsp13]|uniref:hypothetical protein n=1 Tax=Nitrosospira sp. Nsp13 TaxID=1855332 RepID=UPI0008820EB7|nr:hypothetical protein [Nitrosospira sp. Nsp13]SCX77367.1 hypothetical protein SAMN05216308_101114 [Nitrosospira sp. Nsp13]